VELQTKVFTSFSGISALEKIQLLKFFQNAEPVVAAIDAALKHTPSFGGFLISIYQNNRIVGAAIINYTGMAPFFAASVISFLSVLENSDNEAEILEKLINEIKTQADGKISIILKQTHPYYKVFKNYSFLELGRTLVH
jgi:[ribosomal protein S18]-alanine N-acetyltransferase